MSLLPLQLFKNLADETRLGIVLLLKARGELCVCDLCTALAQSQPKISHHRYRPVLPHARRRLVP
ncbi:ArsR family transcriptional regulator, partial [Klebsiella pneumoniae]|uniref:ArsR family transcriptional regulator n=1 Tax=Klebsiella pneumoniae TaxID=573 RepID=UPI00396A2383